VPKVYRANTGLQLNWRRRSVEAAEGCKLHDARYAWLETFGERIGRRALLEVRLAFRNRPRQQQAAQAAGLTFMKW